MVCKRTILAFAGPIKSPHKNCICPMIMSLRIIIRISFSKKNCLKVRNLHFLSEFNLKEVTTS